MSIPPLPLRRRSPRGHLGLLGLAALCWLLPASTAQALSLPLALDATRSGIQTSLGDAPLSGTLALSLGAAPPLAAHTALDVTDVQVAGGGIAVTLDPDLDSPGAGVLRPDGSFLVPTLFLTIDDGVAVLDLTVLDVEGTFGPSAACGGADCLETTFAFDGGTVTGSVTLVASVPEPALSLLLALGLAGLAGLPRGLPEISR